MTDPVGLRAAVRENPEDDTLRLAFADWFDEHGDPDRADFLRTQVELGRTPQEDDRRTALEIRERELLAGHAAGWAAPRPVFPGFLPSESREERKGFWSVFRRGFLEGIGWHELSPDHLKPGGEFEQLFAAHPVRELRLNYYLPGSLSALAERPEVARIESLNLTYFGRGESAGALNGRLSEVEGFLNSPRLGRLRSLSLTLFPTEAGPPARWLRLPVFSRLRRLDVWPRDDERDEFWLALARGCCPELTELGVAWGYDRESPEVGRRFAESDTCKRLARLRVSTSDTSESPFPWATVLANAPLRELEVSAGSGTEAPELLAALAGTPPGRLQRLHLFGINTTGAGVAGWLKSGYAAGVRELDLEYARPDDSDLARLAGSPELALLTRLAVTGYSACTPEGLETLLKSPHLAALRSLEVSMAALTPEAVLCLAQHGHCRGLRMASLGQLTAADTPPASVSPVLSLGRGKPFPHLHTLMTWLSAENHNPEDFRELLDSRQLPNLTALRIGVHESKLEVWRKFASGSGLAWVGGGVNNGHWGVGSAALHPQNVYLPNHLDDLTE
jgi:uncharacterized protein (TIGR02996 family)